MKQANSPLVSVIIPVYNSEEFLEDCLDSVISQTYTNLEIIIINDGSTDNSGDMAKSYMSRDRRVKVIDKKNGGVSSARNVGIDSSSGEYIMFVDSDDLVKHGAVESLVDAVIGFGSDISIADLSEMHTIGYEVEHTSLRLPVDRPFSAGDLDEPSLVELLTSFNSPFNKLIRRTFLLENKLSFAEDLRIAEDLNFIAKAYLVAKSISYTKKSLYLYREDFEDNQSATGSINEDKALDFGKSLLDIRDFIKSNKLSGNIIDRAMRKVCVAHSLYALNISSKSFDLQKKVFNFISKDLFKKFKISSADVSSVDSLRVEPIIAGNYNKYLYVRMKEYEKYSHDLIESVEMNRLMMEERDARIDSLSSRVESLSSFRGAVRAQLSRLYRFFRGGAD